jgi:hypothetical protein
MVLARVVRVAGVVRPLAGGEPGTEYGPRGAWPTGSAIGSPMAAPQARGRWRGKRSLLGSASWSAWRSATMA